MHIPAVVVPFQAKRNQTRVQLGGVYHTDDEDFQIDGLGDSKYV